MLRKLTTYTPGDIAISSVTLAELSFGVQRSSQPEKNQAALERFIAPLEIADFDADAAAVYGRVRASLEAQGNRIGPYDLLIASHALSLGVTLVTHNVRRFARVDGLHLDDWLTN